MALDITNIMAKYQSIKSDISSVVDNLNTYFNAGITQKNTTSLLSGVNQLAAGIDGKTCRVFIPNISGMGDPLYYTTPDGVGKKLDSMEGNQYILVAYNSCISSTSPYYFSKLSPALVLESGSANRINDYTTQINSDCVFSYASDAPA